MSSEVKGIWFVSIRGYIEKTFGTDAWLGFREQFLDEYRAVIDDVLPSEWYPEEMLQDALGLIHSRLARGDDAETVRLIEEMSLVGIGRFFRIMLGLGSPRFAVKQVPTLWKRLRRGPSSGNPVVEAGPRQARLEVTNFPYLADRNYRLLHIGTMQAVLRVVRANPLVVEIEDAGVDWIRVLMRYG